MPPLWTEALRLHVSPARLSALYFAAALRDGMIIGLTSVDALANSPASDHLNAETRRATRPTSGNLEKGLRVWAETPAAC